MEDTGSADDRERPLSEPPPPISDVRLGRYRLAFEMASGGMASLYLAVAESSGGFGKVLALKRIHPHLAKESEFREMFLDEARVASLLHHPNVCGVLDYGEEDGLPFLTMEYVLGEPLSRVHRAQKRSAASSAERARFAARIVADAAHGLHAAHELRDPEGQRVDLVHRDVSPQNLMVTYDGSTRVLDFGIARTRFQEHHTATGTIKGKFAYMAPEQLLGEDSDRRADIWGLGVVLWETLTGSRLFKRKTEMETLLAVTQGPIADPATILPDLDPDLSAIVKRALRRELDARYATAEEMARDLERFLVKDQQLYGAAEVSAHMRELFPGGHERKRQLIADALARRPGPVVPRAQHETESTSVSVDDISIVVSSGEAPAGRGRAWVLGGLAVAALAALVIQLELQPFADAAPELPATRAADEAALAPLQHAPPAADDVADGEVTAPSLTAPRLAAQDTPAVALPDEADEADAPGRGRRRRSRAAAPTAAAAPAPQPSSAPPTAPAAPADDGPRRPFLVESLDMQPAPEPATSERRRPLVVENLEL